MTGWGLLWGGGLGVGARGGGQQNKQAGGMGSVVGYGGKAAEGHLQ